MMMPQQVVQQTVPVATSPVIETDKVGEDSVAPQSIVEASTPTVEEVSGEEFTAPLVGTYYIASKPDAPPFVKEGDTISKGQIICIIEAMKIFNEIEAEHNGVIKKILVSDGTPVEYGQPLMIISPS